MKTTFRPEPHEPEAMPQGWPPEESVMGDHVRRWLAWYVLAGSILTLIGVGWTIMTVREIAAATDHLVRASADGGK